MGGLTFQSGLFDLPASVPHYMTLGSIGRDILGSRESAVIYTPCKAYHLTSDKHPAVSNGSLQLTFDDSLRIFARSPEPRQVLKRFGEALDLVPWRPYGHVPKSDVAELLESIAGNPKAFSQSYVHAHLDLWRRKALKHLQIVDPSDDHMREYAAYMVRYIEHMYPKLGAESMAVGCRTAKVLRFGRKERVNGSSIGYYGWPLEGRVPRSVRASVSSSVELKTNWMKEDFIERVVAGTTEGGIRMMRPSDGYSHSDVELSMSVKSASDYLELFDVPRNGQVKVSAFSSCGIKADSLKMFMRAVAGLAGNVYGVDALKSSKPVWWRLDANPFSAASGVRNAMSDYFRGNDRAFRIFSAQQWMRVHNGMSVYMNFARERHSRSNVYGIIAEGRHGRHASALRHSIQYALRDFGEEVDEEAFISAAASHQF